MINSFTIKDLSRVDSPWHNSSYPRYPHKGKESIYGGGAGICMPPCLVAKTFFFQEFLQSPKQWLFLNQQKKISMGTALPALKRIKATLQDGPTQVVRTSASCPIVDITFTKSITQLIFLRLSAPIHFSGARAPTIYMGVLQCYDHSSCATRERSWTAWPKNRLVKR